MCFSQISPIIQNFSLWCIELSLRFKYPIPLNIVVKLNGKMKKMTKGLLVISHFSGRGKVEENQSSIYQSEILNNWDVFVKST